MSANVWKLLLVPFLLQSVARCENTIKSSLVFVIDNTGSMRRVISDVKSNANKIFDTVMNSESSQIENFVLVTFNDPGVGEPNVTTDRDKFRQALNNIQVYGGGDCPEYSLTGIKRALEVSLPRSNLYVFTDASAKDYETEEEVQRLALEKSSQIDFILTGKCDDSSSNQVVYHNLAKITSGQVFYTWESNINQILKYVQEVIQGRMVELAKADFPPGPNNKLDFNMDEYTGNVHISATGTWPTIDVTGPGGYSPSKTNILREKDASIVVVESKKTGLHTVTIGSTSNTNVIVKGRTTIDFQHGFSTYMPSTIKKSSLKPQPDVKSHLLIDLNLLKGEEVKLNKVQLLDVDGNVILEKSLREINTKERLYATTPFEPPKQMFRILLFGYVVANNNVVKRLAATYIEPESVQPRIILDGGKTEYTALVRDVVLRIPCHATGYPEPTITWKADGKIIIPGPKYSFDDGILIVRSPNVYDNRVYTCIAKNNVGEDHKIFKGMVEAKPKILLEADKTEYTALVRDVDLRIPCHATGYPKPTITWEADGKIVTSDSKYSIEEGTLIVRSPNVQDNRAYTCTATNRLGEDSKTFKGIVEARPRIVLRNGKTTYKASESDRVLKIPCRSLGYPKPTIAWTVDQKPIIAGTKYAFEDGALIVRPPVISDTHNYTCIAKNKLGEDRKTFEGIVEDKITSYDNVKKIYKLKGETFELKCLVPHTESDTVTWFHDPEPINGTEPHSNTLYLLDTKVSENGNYSCRVSNENGYAMDTYEVIFGSPPTFKVYEDDFTDWDGAGTLDCTVDAEPYPTIQWLYEGVPVVSNDEQLTITAWGQYICKVTNVYGSVQRTFNVTSTDCLIHKRTEEEYIKNKLPIMLSENRKWLNSKTINDFLVIPNQKEIILSCHTKDTERNSFKILPGTDEIRATCIGEDRFSVDGIIYKYLDLQCDIPMKPVLDRESKQCLNKDTEIIHVGYAENEVYRVCFDKALGLPLYSQLTNFQYNKATVDVPYLYDRRVENSRNSYSCERSSSTCCLAEMQLMKPSVVEFGAAQRTTYIRPTNTVAFWQACDNSRFNWASIEEILQDIDVVTLWSGVSNYHDQGTVVVPRYLWKVMKFSDGDSLAIIYVNEPTPNDSQVLCKNVCLPGQMSWISSNDKYTYCCQLSDFVPAFNLTADVFEV